MPLALAAGLDFSPESSSLSSMMMGTLDVPLGALLDAELAPGAALPAPLATVVPLTPSDLGGPPINPSGQPATQVRYDFLDILTQRLPKYEVVGVQEEFDAELPADTDGSNETGGPVSGEGARPTTPATARFPWLKRSTGGCARRWSAIPKS